MNTEHVSTGVSFRDLPIWQLSMELASGTFEMTKDLPEPETATLGHSLQMTASRLPTLIASGTKIGKRGMREACLEARAVAAELETLLLLAVKIYPELPNEELIIAARDLQHELVTLAQRLQVGIKMELPKQFSTAVNEVAFPKLKKNISIEDRDPNPNLTITAE